MIYKTLVAFLRYSFNNRTFKFNNIPLKYFFHSYNCYGLSERTIEIPIIRWYLDNHEHTSVLEIGNVTKHYYEMFRDVERDVVDRDEKAYDVFNVDIYDFKPEKQYDFIYSISTFEHMISHTFRNLDYVVNNLLKKNGLFVLSVPIGSEGERVSIDMLNHYLKNHAVKTYFFRKFSEIVWGQIDDIKNGCICMMEIAK